MPNAGAFGPEHGMLPRRHSPPPLAECGWESNPPIQLVEVEGDNSTTKDVSLHKLAKNVMPSLTGNRFEVPLPTVM
jgi:hypothetical protein